MALLNYNCGASVTSEITMKQKSAISYSDTMEPSIEVLAKLCFEKFKSLPKTGKPSDQEWTVLAGIIEHNREANTYRVVSLGCGTKCIGQGKQCPKGFILNDSHAEILARRAFLRYLYHELQKDVDSIFDWDSILLSYKLKEHFAYHFLSTQTPCGDACIGIDLNADVEQITAKRQRLNDYSNVIYTGGKLISTSEPVVDDMEQTPGALRTKPGRGERTLSMSCSDKLSRWNVMGVQGALIDSLIHQPIYFATLNFCCPDARLESIERAIYKRWQEKEFKMLPYSPQKATVRIDSNLKFVYAQRPEVQQPSPNGLNWSDLPELLRPYEISVSGKRQGVTKKSLDTPFAALHISKYNLLLQYIELLRSQKKLKEKFKLIDEDLHHLSYRKCKQFSTRYQHAWQHLKREYFQQWTRKPDELLEFKPQKEEKKNQNCKKINLVV